MLATEYITAWKLQESVATSSCGVHTHRTALRNGQCTLRELTMAAESSLKMIHLQMRCGGEDCANGEISRMVITGRVHEPRSVKQLPHLHHC